MPQFGSSSSIASLRALESEVTEWEHKAKNGESNGQMILYIYTQRNAGHKSGPSENDGSSVRDFGAVLR